VRNEGLTPKFALGLVLATVLIIGIAILTYAFTSGFMLMGPMRPRSISEKVSISGVRFDAENPNTLLVDAKSLWNQTTVFDSAIIKDSKGATVYVHRQVVPDELPANAQMTLAITLSNNMTSGTYYILLATTRGSTFVSPTFTAP